MLSIRYGSHDRAAGGALAEVAEIVMHPDYDNETMEWDFAVLRLVDGVDGEVGEGARVVELAGEDVYSDVEGEKKQGYRVAGWGKQAAGADAGGLTRLREGAVTAVNRKDCSTAWDREIGKTQMCVKHAAAKNTTSKKNAATTSICDGDSGGPLVDEAGKVLHGVVSFGVATCDTDVYPNVFSSVFAAREWILENLE